MAKIIVKMKNPPTYDGQYLTRWEDEYSNRHDKKKPKAVKKSKRTVEVTPFSSDENSKPRISKDRWLALRDRDNPNRRELP